MLQATKEIQYRLGSTGCNGTQTPPTIAVFLVQVFDEDPAQALSVTLTWTSTLKNVAGSIKMTPRDQIAKTFYGQFGPFDSPANGAAGTTITVTIVATDHLGLSSLPLTTTVILDSCRIIIVPN